MLYTIDPSIDEGIFRISTMASASIDNSTVSGRDTHTNGVKKRAVNGTANGKVNNNYANGDVVQTTTEEVKTPPEAPKKVRIHHKYRHVAAIHSKPKTSCLSHDSQISPSFVGFRNLMVIVLVVGNLRLMLENHKKVCYASTNPLMNFTNSALSTEFLYVSAATTTAD